jgi:hypothetical protein
MGRNQLYLEPPPLLLPKPGTCQIHLVRTRTHVCTAARSRVVQIGLDKPIGVCLIHSLVATQQMSAYLLRDHPTRKPGKG